MPNIYSIRTLSNSSIGELTEALNLSFSDYVLPFSSTEQQLSAKMVRDGVDLELSAGAYVDDLLVGFILHGVGIVDGHLWAYNSGTGVIPSARGAGLTTKLYQFITPHLLKRGVVGVKLEVISSNIRAIKSYNRVGFAKVRDLLCFKGAVPNNTAERGIRFERIHPPTWAIFSSFWDVLPSWQNSILAVDNTLDSLVLVAAYGDGSTPIGYIIYNPENKQIIQLAVDKSFRRRGVGSALVGYIGSIYGEELSAVNVDDSLSALGFIDYIGLKPTVNQYEMVMNI